MRGLRWLPYAGLVAADIVAEARGRRRVAKPLLMPALMAMSTARGLPVRRGRGVVSGALLFLLSDHLIAVERLARKKIPPGMVMATYAAGQAPLADALSERR